MVGGLAAWEWARACGRGTFDVQGILTVITVGAAVIATILHSYSVAGWLIAVGGMAVMLTASRSQSASRGQSTSGGQSKNAFWFGLGAVYLGSAFLGFLWLRQDPQFGRAIILWLLAVVWATDIGAYFAGIGIGGPKLAPSISPSKTWSGLCGGVLAAAIVGLIVVALRGQGNYAAFAGMSAALAIVAQVGDLFASSLKRRYEIKDFSNLIPGHGGVLDRIDGLLAAALLAASMAWLKGLPI